MAAALHSCFQCGMSYPTTEKSCPKCDFGRFEHNKGERVTVDIAHNLQTVDQAVQQFHTAVAQSKRECFSELEVIVGGGLINQEISRVLEAEVWKKTIKKYKQEPHNRGAYILIL